MQSLPEVHLIAGTRPEAIKLAPVVMAMRMAGRVTPVLVASGQHPTMVAQALAAFDLEPDVVLPVERVTGSQPELMTAMVSTLDALFADRPPAAVIVQGDTTTTLAGALAAFWRQIPVVHLEAGLRSGDLDSPFPEEGNRRPFVMLADGRSALLDAAHNAAGARALASALRGSGTRPPLVFAASKDKDVSTMIAALAPAVGDIVVTAFADPRAMPADELAARVRTVVTDAEAARVRVAPTPDAALAAAWALAPSIVVAGSIFLLGEIYPRLGRPDPFA